jgi:hypothetical protein
MNLSSISDKINRAPNLDFGDVFNRSIELFKKTWIQGLLLQLFTVIVMLPLIIVFYIPFVMAMIAQAESGYRDYGVYDSFFAGMSLISVLFFFVGMLVLGAVSVALNAGFYRIMKRIDHDQEVATSDFFYFLKGKYLSKCFMLMLVSILIAVPSALLCYIPLLYVMVPMSYFTALFAFNSEMGVGDIVSGSFKLGNKKWLITFGLMIVAGLCVSLISALTCGLGSLFLAAFAYHPLYIIYKDVVGFDNSNNDAYDIRVPDATSE